MGLARSQYTPALPRIPNTTSFCAELCTSPPPVGARPRPSAHRRCLSGLNGAPADSAPCETFLEPKTVDPRPVNATAGQRQRPDPVQHVTEQPPVQMPLRHQQPGVAGVLHQPPTGLHQPLFEARQRPALDPWRRPEPAPWSTEPQREQSGKPPVLPANPRTAIHHSARLDPAHSPSRVGLRRSLACRRRLLQLTLRRSAPAGQADLLALRPAFGPGDIHPAYRTADDSRIGDGLGMSRNGLG